MGVDIYFYDIETKEKLFVSEKTMIRTPVKGDYIQLSDYAECMIDYLKYENIHAVEVSVVILYPQYIDIYIDFTKQFSGRC